MRDKRRSSSLPLLAPPIRGLIALIISGAAIAGFVVSEKAPLPDVPLADSLKWDVQSPSDAEKSVAHKFAPVLAFHPDECFFPMDAQPFLDASSLLAAAGRIVPGWDHTAAFLSAIIGIKYRLDLKDPKKTSTYCSDYERLDAKPIVYARIGEANGRVFVQYWLFYYYNLIANRVVGRLPPFRFNHEADWEVVQVVFPEGPGVEDIAGQGSSITPEYVAYSQHGAAQKRSYPEKVFTEQLRPKVSVALGSHSNSFNAISCTIGISSWLWIGGGRERRAPFPEGVDGEYELRFITEYPWYAFAGRWGTIPPPRNTDSWTDPIGWVGDSNRACNAGDPVPRTKAPTAPQKTERTEEGFKFVPESPQSVHQPPP